MLTFMDADDTTKLIQKANKVQEIKEQKQMLSKSSDEFTPSKYKNRLKHKHHLKISCINEDSEHSRDYSNSQKLFYPS